MGHLVEIHGKAADRDGRLQVKTRTKVQRAGARDRETQIKGDLSSLPFLGVTSVKMLRNTCM